MSSIKSLFKQTVIYGVGNIGVKFINFIVLTPWFTRVLSESEYGLFSEFYVYSMFVAVLLSFGLETTYFRFTTKYKSESVVFTTTLALIVLLSGFYGLSMLSLKQSIISASNNEYNTAIVICFMMVTITDAVCAIPFARLRQFNKAVTYTVFKIIEIGLFIFMNYVFLSKGKVFTGLYTYLDGVFHFNSTVEHVFYANVFSSLLKFLVLVPVFFPLQFSINKRLIREILFFTVPLGISQLAGVLNDVMDRVLFRYLLDGGEAMFQLGLYAANLKLAVLINLLIQVFRYAAEPFFMSKSEESDAKITYARIMYFFIIVVVISGCFIYGNLGWIKFLIDEKFNKALNIVPVLIISNIIYGVYYNLSVWYKVTDLTKFAVLFILVGILVNTTGNIIFLPKYGYPAAAVFRLIGYVSMLVVSYIISLKYYRIPYDFKKILKIVIIGVFLFLLFNFTKNLNLIISLIINNITIISALFYINSTEKILANFISKK